MRFVSGPARSRIDAKREVGLGVEDGRRGLSALADLDVSPRLSVQVADVRLEIGLRAPRRPRCG